MFLTQFNQAFSSGCTHGPTTGILVTGDCVQKGGLGSGQRFFKCIGIEAIMINRHVDNVQAMVGENLKGKEIAGLFDDDGVAGF